MVGLVMAGKECWGIGGVLLEKRLWQCHYFCDKRIVEIFGLRRYFRGQLYRKT